MKGKEVHDMTAIELNDKLTELKSELFNLRFQLAINQLENPMRISAVKKDIARVKTVPVSYTHLDVYKRQYFVRPKRRWKRFRAWNFLLA